MMAVRDVILLYCCRESLNWRVDDINVEASSSSACRKGVMIVENSLHDCVPCDVVCTKTIGPIINLCTYLAKGPKHFDWLNRAPKHFDWLNCALEHFDLLNRASKHFDWLNRALKHFDWFHRDLKYFDWLNWAHEHFDWLLT